MRIMEDFIEDFRRTVEESAVRMLSMTEEESRVPRAEGKWSRKETLGHLIDSAANNHQRFVRLQHEEVLVLPSYQQEEWVRTQNYAAREWREMVELWLAYNRHLAHVIRHDAGAARHVWKRPAGDVDFQYIIEDYLSHLRHHLEQIFATSA